MTALNIQFLYDKLNAEDCTFVSTGNDFIEDTTDTTVVVLTNVDVTAAYDLFIETLYEGDILRLPAVEEEGFLGWFD